MQNDKLGKLIGELRKILEELESMQNIDEENVIDIQSIERKQPELQKFVNTVIDKNFVLGQILGSLSEKVFAANYSKTILCNYCIYPKNAEVNLYLLIKTKDSSEVWIPYYAPIAVAPLVGEYYITDGKSEGIVNSEYFKEFCKIE